MKLENRVALALLQTQPKKIVERLLKNNGFVDLAGLGGGAYPAIGEFEHSSIVEALRIARAENRAVPVTNKQGVSFELERTNEGARLTTVNDSTTSTHFVADFELLDPEVSVRLAALATIDREALPWFPPHDQWQNVLRERPLSEFELSELSEQVNQTPNKYYGRLSAKWSSGGISLLDLFPRSIDFYEALVGPRPNGADVDEYVNEVLRPHHKRLLRDSLVVGLGFCLPAAIRHDVLADEVLADHSDDEVWAALEEVGRLDTPFALLGAVQAATGRTSKDDRFARFACDAIKRLVPKTFCGADGQDAYVLLPPLVRLCFRWISTEESLCRMPGYWRRLAAFVHCHFLLEILRIKAIKSDQFSEWCESKRTRTMVVAELIDLREDPMWRPIELNSDTLRMEILGRLQLVATHIDRMTWAVPSREIIRTTIEALPFEQAAATQFCGPLEGHKRPRNLVEEMPTSVMVEVRSGPEAITSDPRKKTSGDGWAKLSFYSHLFPFDESVLIELTTAVRPTVFDEAESREQALNYLASAAYVAAAQPYYPLAEAIADVIIKQAPSFASGEEATAGFLVLLTAACSITDRSQWLDWLDRKVADFAYLIPKGEPAETLLRYLDALAVMLPLEDWRFGRARKFCSAALR